MGYRSQVRCIIYGTKDNLDSYITETSLITGSTVFQHFKSSLTRYITKAMVYNIGGPQEEILHVLDLYGDDWKWYESYPDVQSWMTFMEEAEHADLQYEFIRVGEDNADVDRRASDQNLGMLNVSVMIQDDIEKGESLPLNF